MRSMMPNSQSLESTAGLTVRQIFFVVTGPFSAMQSPGYNQAGVRGLTLLFSLQKYLIKLLEIASLSL